MGTSTRDQSLAQERHGQVEEPHRSQPDQEEPPWWNQETLHQEAYEHEGLRPQVPEEPEVCQEAQPEPTPEGEEGCSSLNQDVLINIMWSLHPSDRLLF